MSQKINLVIPSNPKVNLTIRGNGGGGGEKQILFNTTAYWNAESIISQKDIIYIYTDLREDDQGRKIAGVKVGDGSAYLADLPFLDELYWDHINDTNIHVTELEKEFWNNKVTCFMSLTSPETLIFTNE